MLSVSGNEKLTSLSSCSASKSNGTSLSGSSASKRKGKIRAIHVRIAVAGVLLIFVFSLAAFMVMKRKKAAKQNDARSLRSSNTCQAFTREEVIMVTDNFSRKIGEGGYGPVFYGRLKSGQSVAVKILSTKSNQGSREFETEVLLLSRIHHKNLVSLIGYCDEAENMILIYEYVSRGNLRDILSGDSELSLDWNQRIKVAFGAAQGQSCLAALSFCSQPNSSSSSLFRVMNTAGLDYLHSGCSPGIVHRDVKSANILLNERLEAKIADFGLSKSDFHDGVTHVSTKVVGTPGYVDPDYYLTNRLNEKSDVFSFGIVLLELITGLQPIIVEPSRERVHIVNSVRPKLLRGDIASIADPRFCGAYDVRTMWKVADIALECTATKAAERPVMSTVVSYLKEAIESGVPTVASVPESPSAHLRGVYAHYSGTGSETSVIYSSPSAR